MSEVSSVAEELYRALADDDGKTLVALVHPDFTGRISAGMPCGVGGSVEGAAQMLQRWGTIAKVFDTAPEPEEVIEIGADRAIVLGHYRGSSRETGQGYDAAFAHDITVRDGKLTSLVQITDTQRWHEALI